MNGSGLIDIAEIAQNDWIYFSHVIWLCQYERDKAFITRLHILSHWSQLWLKWTFGQSNNMIGTIDIRGPLLHLGSMYEHGDFRLNFLIT